MLVRVRSRNRLGHFRVGYHWPAQFVEAEVGEEKLALLEADPRLIVHRAETRNESLPTVRDVQPDSDKTEPDDAWGDIELDRLRQKAAELDEPTETTRVNPENDQTGTRESIQRLERKHGGKRR